MNQVRDSRGKFIAGHPGNINMGRGTFKNGHKGLLNHPNKTSFKKGNIPWHKGKQIYWNRGEKNNKWKGGITKLVEKIRKSFKYRQWRDDVFTRDDFTCQNCGIRGGWLESHHIKLFSKIIEENNIKIFEEALGCEELWNINNGQTLCGKCHNKTKKYK